MTLDHGLMTALGALVAAVLPFGVHRHRRRKLHKRAAYHVSVLAERHGWDAKRQEREIANLKRRKMR